MNNISKCSIDDVVWEKCNFKTFAQTIVNKLSYQNKVTTKEEFENAYGPIIQKKCEFDGAYNDIVETTYSTSISEEEYFDKTNINRDYCEYFLFFMTEDTLWVSSKNNCGLKWYVCAGTIAYVMSQICNKEEYINIKRIGIWNSVGNIAIININDITNKFLQNVCINCIGYNTPKDIKEWKKSSGTDNDRFLLYYGTFVKYEGIESLPKKKREKYKRLLEEKENSLSKQSCASLITIPKSIQNELETIKREDKSFNQFYFHKAENPYYAYENGCYETNIVQYKQYFDFAGKSINNTSRLKEYLSLEDTKFYVIKIAGYYGFFILAPNKDAKICYGGQAFIIKNTKGKDITYFFQYFIVMIKAETTAFGQYYNTMNQLSDKIQSLGFSGRIHGCIIDLDSFNHIMVNPIDNSITFYYSPTFGTVKIYSSFNTMIEDARTNKLLVGENINTDSLTTRLKNNPIIVKENFNNSRFVEVSRSEGMYEISNRMNRIQKIFEIGVLNTWSEEIVENFETDISWIEDCNRNKRLEGKNGHK